MTLAFCPPRLPLRLQGVIAALVTPFHLDGTLDLASFDAQAAFVLAKGVHGVVLNGTTGESPTVRWHEVETLLPRLRAAVARSGRAVPIIVGTGTSDTAESCERTARARAGGADAALAVTPYYSRPSPAGVLAHYQALAAIGLPLVAYHIPSRTGLALTREDLLAILRVPGVVALKESSGNVTMTLALTSALTELDPEARPSLLCG
ncbi:MAG TPA: dihydrodipicolinate synthase family protein, partial [Polyangia bacterium]